MIVRNLVAAAAVTLILSFGTHPSMAQEYPSGPIRFIVPYNPGGSYDTIARLIGNKLTEIWGQEVVIENRPGAGSLIGTEVAAKAAPDGYTIIIFGNNHAILPSIHTKASFDIQKDFDPVALIATIPALLLVNPTVEAFTVQQLIALAKANPGRLNYGSGGNGSATHLGMEMFKFATKTEIVHIPYQAGVPATMDLIAGETQVGLLDVLSARSHVEEGRLRALATTTKERSPFFPQIPAIDEAGVTDFEYLEWYGIMVPAGTPRPIVDQLNEALNNIMMDTSTKERLMSMGAAPRTSTPEEFAAFFDAEIKKNADAVKRAGVRVD